MAVAAYLVDKSAWARMRRSSVAAVLGPLVEQGAVGTCGITDLEMLFSVRSGREHAEVRTERGAFQWLSTPDGLWERAAEVQGALAHRGQHRAASIPDLLIAAVAEHHDVTVLHYDSDFDLIAAVTGQPVEWVVPAGSVP